MEAYGLAYFDDGERVVKRQGVAAIFQGVFLLSHGLVTSRPCIKIPRNY